MTGKYIFLVAVIVFMAVSIKAAAIPSDLQEVATASRSVCLQETGVAEDLIEKFGTGNFVEDDKLKCYFKCILDNFGLIEKDEINFDAMLAIVPDEIKESGERRVKNCRKTTGANLCEKAFNLNKCFYEESPEEFFVI